MALNDLVVMLANKQMRPLPTPRASEGTKGSPNQHGSKGDLTLTATVLKLWQLSNPERKGSTETSTGDHTRLPSDDGKQ